MKKTLVPLFIVTDRFGPVWLPSGGDGGDEGSTTGTTSDVTTTEGTEESTEGDAAETTVDKAKFDKLEADFAALRNQLSASDRNKAKALADLEEVKRKERTELENSKADVGRLTEESTGWKTKFEGLAIQNAFLAASMTQKISWHNPSLALKAADLASVRINENDGSVDGMADLVKKIAKENPFLVSGGADNEDTNGKTTGTASGSNVGNGKQTNKGKPGSLTEEELKKRFPALKG